MELVQESTIETESDDLDDESLERKYLVNNNHLGEDNFELGKSGGVDSEEEEDNVYDEISFPITQIGMSTTNPSNPSYQIQLEIYYGSGVASKIITVDVFNENLPKPFIGGFRHRLSMKEYHHACMQTLSNKTKSKIERNHRETQTKKFKTRSQQTLREQGTQMERSDLTLDTANDRVIYASPNYFSSEQYHKLKIEMAVKIQNFIRRKLARKKVIEVREFREREKERQEKINTIMNQIDHEKRMKEINRRMHPRTEEDFNIMYDELEAWRMKETENIHSTTEPNSKERHNALKELLRKETKLLQTIDRLKIVANEQNRKEKVLTDLEKMAKPKKVETLNTTKINYKECSTFKEGNPNKDDLGLLLKENEKEGSEEMGSYVTTFIETPFTIRARELKDLYNGLNTEMLSVDERLDVLLHVKWTVKEFQQEQLTLDIVELIDREADLLNRGRKDSSLAGLRKRLSNLFLQFIQHPKFNPEAMQPENRKKQKIKLLIKV
ncbi:hypothetical protein ABK040_007980 [Willaertia magna]